MRQVPLAAIRTPKDVTGSGETWEASEWQKTEGDVEVRRKGISVSWTLVECPSESGRSHGCL